jgi:hypothetical protein
LGHLPLEIGGHGVLSIGLILELPHRALLDTDLGFQL